MDNENKYAKYLPLLYSVILVAGIFIGSQFSPVRHTGNNSLFNFSLNRYNKLENAINYILNEYVDSVSKDKLTGDAIEGMLTHLDPHSQYITAKEFHDYNDPLVGNFEGIGIQFRIVDDTITVVRPIPGGPSEKAGLLAGDRIVTVDDSLIAGTGVTDRTAMELLKGKRGTKVKVGVFRRGIKNIMDFTIIRDVIPTYSVDFYFLPLDSTGYIKVSKFSATTAEEFKTATDSMKRAGMTKLILDLRQNTGGYLQAAIDMADEFLDKGKLIVYTQGYHQPRETFYATESGNLKDIELIILIDEGTASASEIVAGAVQDNDRGLIVGRRSFGKGLVQRQLDFIDGSALRLTVARYYTPTGRCIQKPYDADNGFSEYYEESYHRFETGEMTAKDSIHFNDSLKYVTPGGKVVYGGGGIMPDVFVPLNRDEKLSYYYKLIRAGLIFKFAFEYTDKNRKGLSKYKTFEQFNENFDIDTVFDDFLVFATNNGMKTNKKNIAMSKNRIKTLLKAYIARNLFDNEGFYPLFLQMDDTYNKAIHIFTNPAGEEIMEDTSNK